ncbi:MAG: hypothetical protein IPG12_11070 [Saprospiraceae bacterium]|nr:hypothetical protein [Saprospiraceae bacterium]
MNPKISITHFLMVLVIIAVLVVGGGTYYFIHENSTKQKQAILKLDENAKNEIWNLIYSSLINDFKPLANYSVFEPDKNRIIINLEGSLVVVKVGVFFKLPTGSISTETGKEIITEGIDYYDYEITIANSAYQISKKSKTPDFLEDNSQI